MGYPIPTQAEKVAGGDGLMSKSWYGFLYNLSKVVSPLIGLGNNKVLYSNNGAVAGATVGDGLTLTDGVLSAVAVVEQPTLVAGDNITLTPGPSDTLIVASTSSGGGGGSGTVTSVQASGGTTGMTFTGGPVTTAGTLTLVGPLNVANGGVPSTSGNTPGLVLTDPTGGGTPVWAVAAVRTAGLFAFVPIVTYAVARATPVQFIRI